MACRVLQCLAMNDNPNAGTIIVETSIASVTPDMLDCSIDTGDIAGTLLGGGFFVVDPVMVRFTAAMLPALAIELFVWTAVGSVVVELVELLVNVLGVVTVELLE